jgi:hypothetical protein
MTLLFSREQSFSPLRAFFRPWPCHAKFIPVDIIRVKILKFNLTGVPTHKTASPALHGFLLSILMSFFSVFCSYLTTLHQLLASYQTYVCGDFLVVSFLGCLCTLYQLRKFTLDIRSGNSPILSCCVIVRFSVFGRVG